MAIDWAQAKDLFRAALGKPTLDQQRAYVVDAAGANHELRDCVLAMIDVHAQVGTPAPSVSTQDATTTPAASTESELLAPGEVVAGRYKIIELIKEGGMGAVYRAHRITEKLEVALKIIRPGLDSRQVLARFDVEKQALALMKHGNIGSFLDAGMTAANRPFFVMELVKGLPFSDYCNEAKLSINQRLRLFRMVCDAVQHAHQKGVVHRDLKPGNVLIGLYDSKPVPKVIDFGLAKALHQPLTEDPDLTRIGVFMGTWKYASPEQVQPNNLDVDTRTDTYSLGVMLYELLTGETPLDGPRLSLPDDEKRRIIRTEEPPKPSAKLRASGQLAKLAAQRSTDGQKLLRQVRGELDLVTMKALAKNRNERYGSPSELSADIQRYLEGEPVLVVPPTIGYRLSKALRKHTGKVVIAAALAATIILGSVVSTVGWAKAYGESRRANQQASIARAVLDFLREIIGEADPSAQINPDQAFVKDVSLKQVLDQAAVRVDTRFANEPLVKAGVLHAIGKSYAGLYDFRSAHAHLGAAERIRQDVSGKLDADRLSSLHELGRTYLEANRPALAAPLLAEAVELMTQVLGAAHPDTLRARCDLASVREALGQPVLARSLYEVVIKRQKKAAAVSIRDTLTTQRRLAGLLLGQGEHEQAEALLMLVLEESKKHLGDDHPDCLMARNMLALVYKDKNPEKALQSITELTATSERTLGAGDPRHLAFSINRAALLALNMKYAEALAHYETLVPALERVCGRKSYDTMAAVGNQAAILAGIGRYAEAIPLLEEVYYFLRGEFGPASSMARTVAENLADSYRAINDHEKAAYWEGLANVKK